MKTMRRYLAAGAALSPVALAGIGCWPVELTGDCSAAVACDAGTTNTTPPPECVPGQAEGGIDEGCGVFVASAGGEDGDGSKDRPFASLVSAIEKAGKEGKPVYVCAGTFTEAVQLTHDVDIFGGLDCQKDWVPAGATAETAWKPAAGEVPLRVAKGVRATLTDIHLIAADATKPGGSSIGVIVEEGAELDLVRCNVEAGDGADGAPGESSMGTGELGAGGSIGKSGWCSMPPMPPEEGTAVGGGLGGVKTCGDTNVGGGVGGQGLAADPGDNGGEGQPSTGTMGNGGAGQNGGAMCGEGQEGAPGTNGAPGNGATNEMLGSLDASGFVGAPGDDGESGRPGQGGGGGGGAKHCPNGFAGPSGGGGGSGGCGGVGGKAGKGGGASIGIVSLSALLRLSEVNISSGKGGNGGAGANGQPGGAGGVGGLTAWNNNGACVGGAGGGGGQGGRGGGGRGGHSAGIAFLGDAPNTKGANVEISHGDAGAGGDGDDPNGKGAAGGAADVLDFN